jgi:hypothetical protein
MSIKARTSQSSQGTPHGFALGLKGLLQSDMTVHQTGKAAVIRIVVQGFNVTEPNETVLSKVRAALAASVRLIRFYRKSRDLLNKAAAESLPSPARKI